MEKPNPGAGKSPAAAATSSSKSGPNKSTAAKAGPVRNVSGRSGDPRKDKLPPPPALPPPPPAPLFRRVDWITALLATLITLAAYLYTITPDLTLEDSGELAVGSMYAGVPHPPGYPVWTLYSWVFTKILPFSNISWRVSVSSAVAAALACGLLALLVSRGSSMILESIDWFKDIDRKWEGRLCLVSGLVGGLLLGFNGYIWSQAVIVEVYTLSVLSLMAVLALLLRWMYAPHQRKYLYWTFFFFGICLCNHQTLIVAAPGLIVAAIMVHPAIGRDLSWGAGIIWLLGLLLGVLRETPALFLIFNFIGVAFTSTAIWLTLQTRRGFDHFHVVLLCGLTFFIGAAFYFYMPLASMTNPPMNWGYPRTWDGFIHAFTRGQYEKTNPTTDLWVMCRQVWMYIEGAIEEFNFANMLVGLLPFCFLPRMKKRERAWLIGLGAIYFCLAFILLILLNPTTDKQSRELVKVFFTSSHVVIALAIGYGLTLIGALILTQYQRARYWMLLGGAIACSVNLFEVVVTRFDTEFALLRFATVLSLAVSLAFTLVIILWRERVPLSVVLVLFALVPIDSILSHWSDNEQRGHLYGYWFGHDMFDPTAIKGKDGQPLYPEMGRDAVLFGGTDPGRFCPTYMIFCESFIPPSKRRDPKFDRRDVALITQNALADNTYLEYIRAHYNRSAQLDPPFFQEMVRGEKNRQLNRTNLLMKMVRPLDTLFLGIGDSIEKERRAGPSMFKPDHFSNLEAFKAKLAGNDPLSQHLRSKLGTAATGDARSLANGLNEILEGPSLAHTNLLAGLTLTERTRRFAAQEINKYAQIRLNRLILEEAYGDLLAKSAGGLYPDLEVLTPSYEDSARAFNEYMLDAQRRMVTKQLRPGEIVQQIGDRVSVSGQVAVMSINALLCRVIFDKNPQNEFYIEESFPLDWMYPYLSPFGIIMKINREPLAEMTPDMLRRDREFWSAYSERLIGNWITPETPVKDICDFSLRVFKRRQLDGFKGDSKFVRDDNAQKSFSKLRGAIAGVYAWRLNYTTNALERQRLVDEADFAFKQAFAYCPYSPEAAFRYVNYLVAQARFEDAVAVAETCYLFDAENLGVRDLLNQLRGYRSGPIAPAAPAGQLTQLESQFKAAPTNVEIGFALASLYLANERTGDAFHVLDALVESPTADTRTLLSVAEAYRQLNNVPKMESAVARYAAQTPLSPEAWFDLAAIQAAQLKTAAAAANLAKAITLSDERLVKEPKARNLRTQFKTDARFEAVRETPEFQKFR